MQDNLQNRTIFCRDNIDILRGIDSATIDLIYLDPPFNKKKTFTAPIGTSAEGASFVDIFKEEDIKEEWLQEIKEDNYKIHNFLSSVKNIEGRTSYNFCYLAYMAIRLMECYRLLKEKGSIYLHCDPTMSHYLKILMDCIFSENNFRNEIIWQRNDGRGKGSQFQPKKWGANTDTILFYAKSGEVEVSPYEKITEAQSIEEFPYYDKDKKDRYKKGIPIFCSPSMGARPDLCYEWKGFKNPHPSGWRLSKRVLEEEYEKGNIIINGDKIERRKYLKDYLGKPIDNNWTDIPRVSKTEYLGYPTQKPVALLKRILEASSKKGDVVLDPFCGCATTLLAAEELERQWIGIDISEKAYRLLEVRLKKEIDQSGTIFESDSITFKTSPPKRTDTGDSRQEEKYVYIISNKSYPGEYKVGIATDLKNRLNSYQIGDPDRSYKLEYSFLTPHFRDIEKHIHSTYENKHEWVKGNMRKIIADIEGYKR